MSTLQIPPTNTPFLAADGTVNTAWRKFLNGLLERTGGYEGQVVAAGSGIDVTDTDGIYTVAMEDTAVTPGVYPTPTSITVNAQGRITAITS